MGANGSHTLAEDAYETLTGLHSDQERRVIGYYKSHSLRHLLRDLAIGDGDIIRMSGSRRVNESAVDMPFLSYSEIEGYVDAIQKTRETVEFDFDKKTDGQFNSDQFLNWLDEPHQDDIYDIPIDKLTFKFESEQFHTHLWEFIQETYKEHFDERLRDPGEFQQPFYAVMDRAPPDTIVSGRRSKTTTTNATGCVAPRRPPTVSVASARTLGRWT